MDNAQIILLSSYREKVAKIAETHTLEKADTFPNCMDVQVITSRSHWMAQSKQIYICAKCNCCHFDWKDQMILNFFIEYNHYPYAFYISAETNCDDLTCGQIILNDIMH